MKHLLKITLPKNYHKREYIIYLYKNRNDYHKMNNKDINNLLKLINNHSLDDKDYPDTK